MENTQGYSRHDVTRTEIIITFPNGAQYTIANGWLPTMADLKICASDFSQTNHLGGNVPQPTDCGCNNTPALLPATTPYTVPTAALQAIPDGCYTIDYKVYAMEKLHVQTCDYHILAPEFIAGYTIWLNVNGSWINFTSLFSPNDDEIMQLVLTESNFSISAMEIRSGSTVIASQAAEDFLVNECEVEQIITENEILIGEYSHSTIFLCHIQDALGSAIKKVVIKNDKCNNCLKNVTEKEAVSLLAVAIAKLQAVGNNCNCLCVHDTIKAVAEIIKNVVGEC